MTPRTQPLVAAHLATHHGLITAHQARDLGVSTPYIRAALRDREWVVLNRGVYAAAEVWDTLDPWRGRPLLRARAATLTMKRDWVLSHDSAAHALALEVLAPTDPADAHVHVTRPGDTNAWTKNRVKHHLARYPPEHVVRVDGLAVLDHARTVVDMAREHGIRGGLVTADSALRRRLTTKDAMRAVADTMVNWPFIKSVRTVIDLADGRAQSAAESLAREFVLELGLSEPDLQWPVQRSDGRIAWCDLRVGRHVFEVHGKVKVLPAGRGGVADRPAADVLWEARKRERHVIAEGLGVSNLYWEDFFGTTRRSTLARVRAEVAQTVDRFGDNVLPEHLDRAAREIRARQQYPTAS